jgi:hypothetical protein
LISLCLVVLFDIEAIAVYESSEDPAMRSREKHTYIGLLPDYAQALRSDGPVELSLKAPRFDPELLYVECQNCGKPVLWESGKTTELLLAAGVDIDKLDERCMIVSEGCPMCAPRIGDGYSLAVVRIAGLTPEEAMYMARPGGTA